MYSFSLQTVLRQHRNSVHTKQATNAIKYDPRDGTHVVDDDE